MSKHRSNVPDPEAVLKEVEGLKRLSLSLARDSALADDVAQESIRIALQKGPPPAWPLRAWMGGVARNVARSVRRREARLGARERAAAKSEALPSTAELNAQLELQRHVLELVQQLPEPSRLVLQLRYFHELSPPQIAEALDLPLETVRTRLRRALTRLRTTLDAEHGGSRRAWALPLTPFLSRPPLQPAPPPLPTPHTLPLAGALAMKKLTVSVLAILALGVGAAFLAGVFETTGSDDGDAGSGLLSDGGPDSGSAPELRGRQGDLLAEASRQELPPAVDLSAVDRQRDLHGVVARTDGQPVAGARLQTIYYPWQRGGMQPRAEHYYEEKAGPSTLSAGDGTFSIRLPERAVVGLRAEATGFAGIELVSRNAGERLRIVMQPVVRLQVTVSDEKGVPIEAAVIRVKGREVSGRLGAPDEGESDAQGRVVFQSLMPGTQITISAHHPLYGLQQQRHDVPQATTASVDIAYKPGRRIVGRALDATTGTPIAGARIGYGWMQRHPLHTDEAGRYEIHGWTGQYWQTLTATAPGYAPLGIEVRELDAVDFKLQRGVVVSGRVVTETGTPVADAQVSGTSKFDTKKPRGSTRAVILTDAGGRFSLPSVRSDLDLQLVVLAPGWGRHGVTLSRTTWAAGPLDLGDIELLAAHTISGTVVDSNGRPAQHVRIYIGKPKNPAVKRGRTSYVWGSGGTRFSDDLGRFTLGELTPGAYRISASGPHRTKVQVDLVVPEDGDLEGIKVVIPATRTLRVVVVDTEGQPVGGLGVSTMGAGRPMVQGAIDDRGMASLQITSEAEKVALSFPGDTYHYFAGKGNKMLSPADEEVRFVLQRALPTLGRVLDSEGKPVAGLHVHAHLDGKEVSFASCGKDGRFKIAIPTQGIVELVVTGRAQVKTAGGGFQGMMLPYRGRIERVVPGAKDVVLRVATPVLDRKLTVRVTLPDGSPAKGALVRLYPVIDRKKGQGRADEQGVIRFTALSNEPVSVSARWGGREIQFPLEATAEKVVPSGQTLELRIRAGAVMTGLVLDPDERPLAGVELSIYEGQKRINASRTLEDGRFGIVVDPQSDETLRFEVSHTAKSGAQWIGVLKDVRQDQQEVILRLTRAK